MARTLVKVIGKKNLWQRKLLTSDVTNANPISDLSFALEVGKTYKITLTAVVASTAADATANIVMRDSATSFATLYIANPDSATNGKTYTLTTIRTMTTTSLLFQSSGFGGTIEGNNTLLETNAVVEELENYENTTGW